MSNPTRLAILEELTIYHAMDQKQQLLDALANSQALELDLSQVAEIDTAGLQLLTWATYLAIFVTLWHRSYRPQGSAAPTRG